MRVAGALTGRGADRIRARGPLAWAVALAAFTLTTGVGTASATDVVPDPAPAASAPSAVPPQEPQVPAEPAATEPTAGVTDGAAAPSAPTAVRSTPDGDAEATAGADVQDDPTAAGSAEVPTAATAALPSTGSPGFVSLAPVRLLDTRSGNGAPKALISAGRTVDLTVLGRGGVPSSGVSSVVLNVTATTPTSSGYVTIYPTGASRPVASSVNFAAGQTVANLVVAKVGSGGRVTLYNAVGSVNVIADVQGYFQTGSDYVPLEPVRILDTRSGNGAPRAAVGAGGTVDLTVLGRGNVPGTGVSAVALNVTATSPTSSGFVSVFPTGASRPASSNLNLAAGRTSAVAVITAVGTGGKVSLFNAAGSVQLIADVAGYFTTGGGYVPLTPQRMFDSRVGVDGEPPFGALLPGDEVDMQVTGYAGVAITGASAVVISLTAVAPTASGFLTEFPFNTALPTASNVNFARGATTPNLVIAKVGAGGWISIFNPTGNTHVIVDVLGYFTTDAVPTYEAGQTVVASVDIAGDDTTGSSGSCPVSVSENGRYVLFTSDDPLLAPHFDPPAGAGGGVYIRDTVLGVTSAVTLPIGATSACSMAISADGRWALWTSDEAYFAQDTNDTDDVFQTDLLDGLTYHVSWSVPNGAAGNGASTRAGMSSNGQFVAFQSEADDLTETDTNGPTQDVFLADMDNGTVLRVGPGSVSTQSVTDDGQVAYTSNGGVPGAPSKQRVAYLTDGTSYTQVMVSSAGGTPDDGASDVHVNPAGTVVSFTSSVSLNSIDTNAVPDVYRRDVVGASTTLVTRSAANGSSSGGTGSTAGPVSDDGAVIVYGSTQSNLVSGQTAGGQLNFRWTSSSSTFVSATTAGVPANGVSGSASVSSDGRFAGYETSAANLTGSTSNRAVVTRIG